MRLSFILVAVVTTLVAACDDVSASGPNQLARIGVSDVNKTARFLRKIETHENGEERALEKIDDLLARLKVAEVNVLHKLNKFDADILRQINLINGAPARIQRWKEAELDPIYVASMMRKYYPSLSPDGTEWQTWRLFAAQYLRQHHSLNPTV